MRQFIYRHSRQIFDLLSANGTTVSLNYLSKTGFMFGIQSATLVRVFGEFEASRNEVLYI